jgi:HPt (histidine-containing phosphotransfer) domain-containing protein
MEHCNLSYLKNIVPGNNTLAIQVIELFIEEVPKYINEFKHSCSENNWSDLYKYSHKLKPSIEILGFPTKITELLKNINLLSKTETNTDKLVDLVKYFLIEIESILPVLENQLKNLKSEQISSN